MRSVTSLKSKSQFGVRLAFIGSEASIATYIVDLGQHRVTVHLLNLPGDVCVEDKLVGSGGFGTVIRKSVAGTPFVAKVIKLRNRKTFTEELEEVVCEIAINKLCAMYGIGPDVETSIHFDLIVYNNAVQFHLELCSGLNELRIVPSDGILKEQLLYCLEVLHELHIAHKDIKPDNILYCSRLGRFVLCDFGTAEYVTEDVGLVSWANCAGTPLFMGPEMHDLHSLSKNMGEVDLYYNDVCSLQKSLRLIKKPPYIASKFICLSPPMDCEDKQ